jgi:hypothetical protein
MAGVHAAFLEFAVIVGSFGAKGEKAHKYLPVACFPSLSDQHLGTVPIFDVLIATIGSCMAGNELVAALDADPVRIRFES